MLLLVNYLPEWTLGSLINNNTSPLAIKLLLLERLSGFTRRWFIRGLLSVDLLTHTRRWIEVRSAMTRLVITWGPSVWSRRQLLIFFWVAISPARRVLKAGSGGLGAWSSWVMGTSSVMLVGYGDGYERSELTVYEWVSPRRRLKRWQEEQVTGLTTQCDVSMKGNTSSNFDGNKRQASGEDGSLFLTMAGSSTWKRAPYTNGIHKGQPKGSASDRKSIALWNKTRWSDVDAYVIQNLRQTWSQSDKTLFYRQRGHMKSDCLPRGFAYWSSLVACSHDVRSRHRTGHIIDSHHNYLRSLTI